ncbi:hypothetical protein DMB42_09360 [Nonomuraea sp. WAC 01424]|nr:hypothetical protein DMB42_09360 [Nonomuraea sp. WAC 01424]
MIGELLIRDLLVGHLGVGHARHAAQLAFEVAGPLLVARPLVVAVLVDDAVAVRVGLVVVRFQLLQGGLVVPEGGPGRAERLGRAVLDLIVRVGETDPDDAEPGEVDLDPLRVRLDLGHVGFLLGHVAAELADLLVLVLDRGAGESTLLILPQTGG